MSEILTPQQLASEGQRAYQAGDYLAAAGHFEAAQEGYRLAGDPLRAAEMANDCSVASLRAGQARAALQAVEGTPPLFETAGDTRRQALALGNRAAALEALGRKEEALADYAQSAELLKQIGENDLRLHVMQALSALQLRSGRQLQAVATMQAGLNSLERPSPRQRLLKKLLDLPFKIMNRGL